MTKQSLSEEIKEFSKVAGPDALHAVLSASGVSDRLDDLSESQRPGRFRGLMADFLTRPISDISVEQIRCVIAEVHLKKDELTVSPSEFLDLLRKQGRVHGVDAIKRLGFDETRQEPEITEAQIRKLLSAPVKSMLHLDDGRSVMDYARASVGGWQLILGDVYTRQSFITDTNSALKWVISPMEICQVPRTLGELKQDSLERVRDHFGNADIGLPDARDLAKGLLLHERATKEKLLWGVYTSTNQDHVVIGAANAEYFYIRDDFAQVKYGSHFVAVAPQITYDQD